MKKYGMILTDNGWDNDSRKWWIYGVSDERWNTGDLWDLTSVQGSAFEAVDVSSLMIDPDSGQARVGYSTSGTTTPSITVTAPNGGETWKRGTSNTVTWDYSGNPGSYVKIVLLKSGVEVGTISASTSIGSNGHGSYTWPINPSGTTGSDYKVSVQSTSQPTIKETSNGYFTLTSATTTTTTSSITVTAPYGGESWKHGTSNTVTWDYSGNPGSYVKIVLLKSGIEVGTATYSTSIGSNGHGSYTWTISSTRAPGTDYKILVQSVSQPSIKDSSNNYFTITS
jgi:hypothetical protein